MLDKSLCLAFRHHFSFFKINISFFAFPTSLSFNCFHDSPRGKYFGFHLADNFLAIDRNICLKCPFDITKVPIYIVETQ